MGEDGKRAQADEKGAAPKDDPEPEGGSEGAPGAEPEPEGGGEPRDGHGQPGINREKYRRDIDARDKKIAELKSECPFPFETKQTGLKPEGGTGKDDEELVDRILGKFK